jgi:folylpolyglutamate synthase/dihydropteroate synthase
MTLELDQTADAAYFEISNVAILITRKIEVGVMGDCDATNIWSTLRFSQ